MWLEPPHSHLDLSGDLGWHYDIGTTVDLPSQWLPSPLKTSEKPKENYGAEVILHTLFCVLSHSIHP